MDPNAPGRVSLGIYLSKGSLISIDKEIRGKVGAYVEWMARGLIFFFDPAERKRILVRLHGRVDGS